MDCETTPSDFTLDYGSVNSLQSQETLSQDSPVRESMSTEWTDKKHSMYLKSMEASFVNDLYNSADTLGWRSQRQLGEKHSNTCISSGQYKVLRGGCWEKNVLSCDLQERISFGSLELRTIHKIALAPADLTANMKQFPLCRSDSVGNDTEVTDQNFIDEDSEGEKANHVHEAKRRKILVVPTSSNDQVVPFGKRPLTQIVRKNPSVSGRKRS
ncbi:hypothetical protein Vadar_009997 [Vaccinium darrowii]|uniref:Uncharacterized protein n=1 Tax=Vaccinium darrowii TaxID=229202 RepID=A0ACB7XYU0_9ERIC|nr:hypothetical protein Vadar_009997 [Vaccinium darrowii]